MTRTTTYFLLCIAGTVLPYAALYPFLRDHGADLPLLLVQLAATPVAAFFAADVVVSALALLILIAVEGPRSGTPRLWLPVVATMAVGVSLGLPLFLYLRERALVAHARPVVTGGPLPPGTRAG